MPKNECSIGPPPGNVTVCVRRSRKRVKLPTVTNSASMCKVVRNAIGTDRESFYGIALNPQLQVLGIEEVAKGQVDGVSVHPREVFKSAILQGASSVVIAHNHPSGNPQPSPEDMALTDRMVAAGKVLGIPVLDHVVISHGGGCVSIADRHPGTFRGAGLGKTYALPKPSEGAQTIRDRKRK